MAQLEDKIEQLVQELGHIKVRLQDPNSGSSEGIWAVPASKADKDKYLDESSQDEEFEVYLCNNSIYWPHGWGTKITVRTNGQNRPYGKIEDN